MTISNPILNYNLQINDCPTVDIDALKKIFSDAHFDVNTTPVQSGIEFNIIGKDNTNASGIHIQGNVIREEDGLVLGGYSTVINGVNWDCYSIVKEGLYIDDMYANDETELLIQKLNIFALAEQYI